MYPYMIKKYQPFKYPKDKRARDALYNAAVFYAGVGEVQSSTKLRERYLKLFGCIGERYFGNFCQSF